MKMPTEYSTRTINTTKLHKGMVVKNYKVMCELLGEQELCTRSRRTQMENWARFFEFTKDGQKIIIGDIYEEPLDFQVGELRKSLFTANGQYFIMEMLERNCINKDKPFVLVPRVRLYKELRLIDNDFTFYKRNRVGFKQKLNELDVEFTDEQIDTAFTLCDDKCYSVLNTILKSMRRKYLISWEKVYLINKNDGRGWIEEEYDLKINKEIGETIVSYADEARINETNKEVLNSFVEQKLISVSDFAEITKKKLFDKYYNEVNRLLFEKYGWIGCYKVYKMSPIVTATWDNEKALFKDEAEDYAERIKENFFNKVNEKCGKSLNTDADRKMVELLLQYILKHPNMTDAEFQALYRKCVNEVTKLRDDRLDFMEKFDQFCRECFYSVPEAEYDEFDFCYTDEQLDNIFKEGLF